MEQAPVQKIEKLHPEETRTRKHLKHACVDQIQRQHELIQARLGVQKYAHTKRICEKLPSQSHGYMDSSRRGRSALAKCQVFNGNRPPTKEFGIFHFLSLCLHTCKHSRWHQDRGTLVQRRSTMPSRTKDTHMYRG